MNDEAWLQVPWIVGEGEGAAGTFEGFVKATGGCICDAIDGIVALIDMNLTENKKERIVSLMQLFY